MKFSIYDINNLSDAKYKKWYALMGLEKQNRVDLMYDFDDKKRTVCGEMLARTMISRQTDLPCDSIEICTNEFGKPYAKNAEIEFNISHSGDYVVCVLSEKPIGIDIQKIKDINAKLAFKYYQDNEFEYVFGCDKSNNIKPFIQDKRMLMRYFEVWTRREAMAKCSGKGLFKHDYTQKYNITTVFLDDYVISIAK